MAESVPSFTVTLQRKNGKRMETGTIQNNLTPVINRSTSGTRSNWTAQPFRVVAPISTESDGLYLYKTTVTYERRSNRNAEPNRLTNEMNAILGVLKEAGQSSRFGEYPWTLNGPAKTKGWKAVENPTKDSPSDNAGNEADLSELVDFESALTLEDIEIPDVLINGTDAEIEAFPAFQGLYGRSAHVRVMASSIKTMKDTGGMRRNHVLLHGLPGCAKSSLFKGMQTVIGHGGFIALNANSATRAGIEAIFLRRLKQTGCPPIVFIEEIEKTLEAILTVWLSMMDERAEVRKVTNNEASRAETRVLCFGSANDKVLFDRLMGGRPGHPGALSSRFTKPLYVPRPNRDTMQRILLRDIKLYGGNPLWAEKALDIADEVGTNDPRIVLAYLDGGERLLNGKYKDDIMTIHRLEQEDKKKEPVETNEE
jgi:hypothetical protein